MEEAGFGLHAGRSNRLGGLFSDSTENRQGKNQTGNRGFEIAGESGILNLMEQVEKKEKSKEQIEPIEWQAPEFEYDPKGVSWFWLSLIVAIILVAVALWQQNFLFAIFVAVAELLIITSANRFPHHWNFRIDESGVHIVGHKSYLFEQITGFDFHEDVGDYDELVLEVRGKFSPYVKINIFKEDKDVIKEVLSKILPQKTIPESFSDTILKILRF